MIRLTRLLLLITIVLVYMAPRAYASEEHQEEHNKYALAVFVGGTEAHENIESTLGLELTYHINHLWSAWGLVERSDREKSTTLLMGGLGLHPYKDLVLIVGAGFKDPSEEHENTLRFGAAYYIELENNWFIEPYVGTDIIENEEHETVLGVYFGKKF